MNHQERIEAVAQAIHDQERAGRSATWKWADQYERKRKKYRRMAEAALLALESTR